MTRVLIVDDKPVNLYLLQTLLKGNGFCVDEARNGAEALAKARESPPQLAISDLLMPVMDGYTLLRHWKADERLRPVPFVVYTATYTDPKDERLALDLGAAAFILKPSEPEPFIARIREVLEKKDWDQSERPNSPPIAENVLLQGYNEVLVRKLEKKALELEKTNRALLEDIAKRERAEAEVARTTEALKLRDRAIQSVSQGIIITDPNQPDNPVVYVGAGVERITGYPPAEVLGRNCRFLHGEETDPAAVAKLHEAIAAGRACSVEILNYRKDGRKFWNALSLSPVHDESGALTQFIGIQNDVTERKSLEDQLRQSQKMEAVGRLAGGVAHDFNNLLTIIAAYSEILLATPGLSDEVGEAVKAISEAGERAASLTRQLLGFSRRAMLQPEVVDVNALVAQTAKMLRRLIGANVLLTTVLRPDVSRIKVDPGQLDQVLMNLVVNARDAMPTGGKLTVESANVFLSEDYAASHIDCKPGHHVMLAVTDTGCGMTPEIKARIFEPFFTTKGIGKGTGLGLAMVFGIVQQSEGCIHVYSEPGRGTTFKIYFPAVSDPLTKKEERGVTPGARGTETILLVEDEDGVRGVALLSLQLQGYKVLTAVDGKDALRVVHAHHGALDLVLTDVVMPNTGGPELVKALQERFPKLKTLYMSGYTDDAVVRHGLLETEVRFIQKPYTPSELARKVRQVLDENGS